MKYKLAQKSINYYNFFSDKVKITKSIYYKKLFDNLNKYSYEDNIDIKLSTKNVNQVNINYLKNNKFISDKIIQSVQKLNKFTKCIFVYKNVNVNINVYHKSDLDISKFLTIVSNLIKFIINLSNFKQPININYYLTDCKKIIKHRILTPDEVNTGSSNSKIILIWRKQEVFKTTIHELIHYTDLDNKYTIDNDLERYYLNKYESTSNNMLINESYTDFIAILINLFLTTKLLNKDYNFFIKILHLEILFIKYQAMKILNLNKNYNKYTSVLPYYVIKAELFNQLPKTLKIINSNLKEINLLKNHMKTFNKIKKSNKINDNDLSMTIINLDI
tara:strand:- start:847 stop:1842 length:996 start_codon:yes stop_codon:yes gene_type:complete